MRSSAFAILAALVCPLAGCAIETGTRSAYLDACERGQGQIRNRDYAAARNTFRGILGEYPDQIFNSNIELLLADCERELGNDDEAVRLRKKVAADAKSPDLRMRAHFGLGKMALDREDFAEAVVRFKSASASARDATPDERASLLCETGIALQKAGRFAEARQSLSEAIAAAPRSVAAKHARIQLLYPDHFAVQTGAFSQAANAEQQKELLSKRSFPAEILRVETAKGVLNCVRVGRYGTRAEAKAALERIRQANILPARYRPTVKP